MSKKYVSLFLLLAFCLPAFASDPIPSVQPIREIVSALKEEQQKSAEYIQNLETSNEQIMKDLQTSLESQKKQMQLLENYGNLIDDQAIYYNSLKKKSAFWMIFSIISTSLLAGTVGTTLIVSQTR